MWFPGAIVLAFIVVIAVVAFFVKGRNRL